MKKVLALLALFALLHGLALTDPPASPSAAETRTIADNGTFGVPSMTDVLSTTTKAYVYHDGYIVGFDCSYHEPLFVEYRLDRGDIEGNVSRRNNFRPDPLAPGCASLADYRRSGYDRGHMMPAADAKSSPRAMSESFFLSNMCPQTGELNRGPWEKLEEFMRSEVKTRGPLWILSGPAFDRHTPVKTIGKGVVVPTHFWKVALAKKSDGGYTAIGFLLPNSRQDVPDFRSAVVSVDAIELATGLDFFDKLPDSVEESVENHVDLGDWFGTDSTTSAHGDSAPTSVPSPAAE